ncbi:acid protease [Clavulina sp. PMI_390]|nr:acid protease [Clavulina sp. PMI_390]
MVRTLAATGLVALALLPLVTSAPSTLTKRVSLPIKKRGSNTSTSKDIVNRDLARLAHYNSRSFSKRDAVGTVTNEDVSYVALVTICGKEYSLIVDTGSSNTWVSNSLDQLILCLSITGAGQPFAPNGCQRTGNSVSVRYGSGSFGGEEYTGDVNFAGLTAASQSFGVASSSTGFDGVDGIIGFGPVDLTEGTVSGVNTVPTFMDTLYSQGAIPDEVLGVYFSPESGSDTADVNGELSLGAPDATRYTGTLSYFRKSTMGSFASYWGLSGISLQYNKAGLGTGSYSAIVDTGTTLIYIPTLAYDAFLVVAGGGETDSASGLARFKKEPTGTFTITVGGVAFPLSPAQYLVPQAQYSNFGLSSGYYYSWINNGGTFLDGVNFIIGQKFLENYYSVYDTTDSRIGFAPRT